MDKAYDTYENTVTKIRYNVYKKPVYFVTNSNEEKKVVMYINEFGQMFVRDESEANEKEPEGENFWFFF